jgi:hypothetical protein
LPPTNWPRAALLAQREKLKASNPAFKTRDKGVVTIVINAEPPFADVFGSQAHELGQAKQDFDHPSRGDGAPNDAVDGLQEAEAQQFERAFWLTLEARLGATLTSYPASDGFEAVVDSNFDTWIAGYAADEHDLGHLTQWLAVLADPQLASLDAELTTTGGLSAAASLALFDYLVAIDPVDAAAYVDGQIAQLAEYEGTMRTAAKARLVDDLAGELEGRPDLTIPALMTP